MAQKILFLFLLSLLAYTQGAKAQFLWQVSQNRTDSTHIYCLTELSCSGDNCTAWGLIHEFPYLTPKGEKPHSYRYSLCRTTDGGISWKIQDPRLPGLRSTPVFNYVPRVQQIDSLNIVAVGDTGLIIRTFDGGVTWQKQDAGGTIANILGVEFSDSLNGILTTSSSDFFDRIFITSDGGRHWDPVIPSGNGRLIECHTRGPGKYSILSSDWGYGSLYQTEDNWKTRKTINLIDTLADSNWWARRFYGSVLLGKDTIIVYGGYSRGPDLGIIMRSTNGGGSWEKPYITPWNIWAINRMTPSPKGDTLLAGCVPYPMYFISTDRDATWKSDTLISNVTDFPVYTCHGLAWTGDHPLGIFSGEPSEGAWSAILSGFQLKNSIKEGTVVDYHQRIYPNPATSTLNIVSIEASSPYHIYDLLGRSVLSGKVLDRGTLSVDVSHLPRGMYYVFVDDIRDGHAVLVGKLVLIGE